jgi:hypothetical protein
MLQQANDFLYISFRGAFRVQKSGEAFRAKPYQRTYSLEDRFCTAVEF